MAVNVPEEEVGMGLKAAAAKETPVYSSLSLRIHTKDFEDQDYSLFLREVGGVFQNYFYINKELTKRKISIGYMCISCACERKIYLQQHSISASEFTVMLLHGEHTSSFRINRK